MPATPNKQGGGTLYHIQPTRAYQMAKFILRSKRFGKIMAIGRASARSRLGVVCDYKEKRDGHRPIPFTK